MDKKLIFAALLLSLTACSAQEDQTGKPTLAEIAKKQSIQSASASSEASKMDAAAGEAQLTIKPASEEGKEELKEEPKEAPKEDISQKSQAKTESTTATQTAVSTKEASETRTPATASTAPKAQIHNYITWDEFFDNEKQNTPSNKFWDLKGETVVIDGFMGEVLSLRQGWFLLIPSPGAECPFDNGDESYWNKIMIVFVKDSKGLRFEGGPLRIKGRLDVGVKIDESNYKTMFRLYDATFEKIN
jgi:hypothetical protein